MIRKFSGIYCFENLINGKKYIGRATVLRERINYHLNRLKKNTDPCKALQNSWNKYGSENFKWYVLLYCEKEFLDEYEIKLINIFHARTYENGYNITMGGEGNNGWIPSEETKRKISESNKGRIISEEQRMEISIRNKILFSGIGNPFYGKKHSEESKIKIAISKIGNRNNLGRVITQEHKDKISMANKGRPSKKKGVLMTQGQKDKISVANSGKKPSQEAKNKNAYSNMGEKKRKNSSSKYVGVSYDKKRNIWRYYITINGDVISGKMNTEIECAIAYNEIATEYFGYRAKLNMIIQEEYDNLFENLFV